LFDAQRIVFIEVPFGETFCRCTQAEYADLVSELKSKFERRAVIR
jgi:hypothetical protein